MKKNEVVIYDFAVLNKYHNYLDMYPTVYLFLATNIKFAEFVSFCLFLYTVHEVLVTKNVSLMEVLLSDYQEIKLL